MYNLDYEKIKRKNFKEHAGYFASVVFTLFMFTCFLVQNEKLIKNQKYKILGYWTGTSDNRHYIQKFEIDYTFPSGTKTKLYSNPIEYDDIKEHEK